MKHYQTIQEWLDEHIAIKAVESFLPSAIMKVVPNVTINDIYDVCEEYKNQGKLALQYDVLCPNCYSSLGIYNTFSSLPNQIDYCKCGEEDIEAISSAIVIYKIVR